MTNFHFQVERQKIQRETKKKQEAKTLVDTRNEISSLEIKLAQLKEEKHQLFHTLKKVIAGTNADAVIAFIWVILVLLFHDEICLTKCLI